MGTGFHLTPTKLTSRPPHIYLYIQSLTVSYSFPLTTGTTEQCLPEKQKKKKLYWYDITYTLSQIMLKYNAGFTWEQGKTYFGLYIIYLYIYMGHALAQLVEAMRYKSEGRGFDSRWCQWHNPSGRTVVLGSTQPVTEMSTRNTSWG